MPLPALPLTVKEASGGFKALKESTNTTKQEIKKETSPQSYKPTRVTQGLSAQNSVFAKTPGANKNSTTVASTNPAFSRNQEANERALERSRGGINPLVPLIKSIGDTLIRNR